MEDAELAVIEYMEVWFNRRRLHFSLNNKTTSLEKRFICKVTNY